MDHRMRMELRCALTDLDEAEADLSGAIATFEGKLDSADVRIDMGTAVTHIKNTIRHLDFVSRGMTDHASPATEVAQRLTGLSLFIRSAKGAALESLCPGMGVHLDMVDAAAQDAVAFMAEGDVRPAPSRPVVRAEVIGEDRSVVIQERENVLEEFPEGDPPNPALKLYSGRLLAEGDGFIVMVSQEGERDRFLGPDRLSKEVRRRWVGGVPYPVETEILVRHYRASVNQRYMASDMLVDILGQKSVTPEAVTALVERLGIMPPTSWEAKEDEILSWIVMED